jgi:hypothetical protein
MRQASHPPLAVEPRSTYDLDGLLISCPIRGRVQRRRQFTYSSLGYLGIVSGSAANASQFHIFPAVLFGDVG